MKIASNNAPIQDVRRKIGQCETESSGALYSLTDLTGSQVGEPVAESLIGSGETADVELLRRSSCNHPSSQHSLGARWLQDIKFVKARAQRVRHSRRIVRRRDVRCSAVQRSPMRGTRSGTRTLPNACRGFTQHGQRSVNSQSRGT